jgi:exopolysaccharide biosynthesis protein
MLNPMRRDKTIQLNPIQFLLPILLAFPIVAHSFAYFQRPARTPLQRSIANGINYERVIWQQPRPVVLHVATIDLTRPQLNILVTPYQQNSDQYQLSAMTTSEFLDRHKLQLAVNASYFHPFNEDSPWNYYPKSGERVNAVGQAISQGNIYSDPFPKSTWAMICFDAQNRVQILPQPTCPNGTQQAVSGNEMIFVNQPPDPTVAKAQDADKPYPRLILAQDKPGKRLWAIAVDGKQPGYSEGVKLKELIPFLRQLGADRAINLDGGGSTTMVMAKERGTQVLNAPIHNKIPMTERPVANHIGFSIR